MNETLTEMFDRIIKSVCKRGDMHWEWGAPDITPIGIETSVQSRLRDAKVDRLDVSTDLGALLRDKRPKTPHDMPVRVGRMATGGVIQGDVIGYRADGSEVRGTLFIL